jgi:hypothetical protein
MINAQFIELDPFENSFTEIVQFYETCEIRHGILTLMFDTLDPSLNYWTYGSFSSLWR